MAYAIIGDDCALTIDGADHRSYSFSLTKDGSAIDAKAFVDPPGFTPQVMAQTFVDLTVNFRDNITEQWDPNDEVTISYTMLSATTSGYYKVKNVLANTVPVDGIADFSASFRKIPALTA